VNAVITPRWWTAPKVVCWVENPRLSVESILYELQTKCGEGRVQSRWKAKRVAIPAGSETFGYVPHDQWESVPLGLWQLGFIGFVVVQQEGSHTAVTDRAYGAGLRRGTTVEVQFFAEDVRNEMRRLRPKKASRLKPFWDEQKPEIFRWLDEYLRKHDPLLSGDGGQAALEKHIATLLEKRRQRARKAVHRRASFDARGRFPTGLTGL
jgi:hypothetical protein